MLELNEGEKLSARILLLLLLILPLALPLLLLLVLLIMICHLSLLLFPLSHVLGWGVGNCVLCLFVGTWGVRQVLDTTCPLRYQCATCRSASLRPPWFRLPCRGLSLLSPLGVIVGISPLRRALARACLRPRGRGL